MIGPKKGHFAQTIQLEFFPGTKIHMLGKVALCIHWGEWSPWVPPSDAIGLFVERGNVINRQRPTEISKNKGWREEVSGAGHRGWFLNYFL